MSKIHQSLSLNKFVKMSVDSNPHLKNLRRRMSIKKSQKMHLSPVSRKGSSFKYTSTSSLPSSTQDYTDEDNFYFDK